MKRTKSLKLAVLPDKRKDCCCTPETCTCKKPQLSADSFFGISRSTAHKLTGAIIEGGGPLTPETVEEAVRIMWERSGLAPCESPDGSFHHLSHPTYPHLCCLCGWAIDPVRY